MPRFELSTRLDASPDVLFDVSLDVDTHLSSFQGHSEELVDGPTSRLLTDGDQVTWRARHFGVWWTMTSEIVEYERPRRFVDQQVKGPFKRYRHEHVFEREGDSTVMKDVVELAAPLGPLGWLADRLFLVRYMKNMIETRNDRIVEIVSDPPTS